MMRDMRKMSSEVITSAASLYDQLNSQVNNKVMLSNELKIKFSLVINMTKLYNFIKLKIKMSLIFTSYTKNEYP